MARGWGVANSLVALNMGFRYFDSSIGAVGGQPQTGAAMYHRGFAGNTCTEDLVGMFEEMGVDTGIDQSRLAQLGHTAENVLGRQLRSNFLHPGPVPHSGIVYDKEASEFWAKYGKEGTVNGGGSTYGDVSSCSGCHSSGQDYVRAITW